MAPNSSPATLTRMIIELILSKRIVHYQDIMEYTGTSRKTIAKYLNEVEKVVNQQGVHLVRKRGQGIRFSGNTKGLLAEFPILKDNSQSEQERRISIMTFLTQQSKPVLLDDIADHFFISRSTLERDLNVLKMDYGLKLTATTEGVKFNSSESDVRRVIGQLLQSYWGQEIKQNQQTGKMTRTFKVPQSLKRYVNKQTLNQMQKVLNKFVKILKVDVNEYQYESLLIHTTIAIQRIKNGEFITQTTTQNFDTMAISPSTNKLVKMLIVAFKCEIPDEEIAYLNMHVAAIEDGYIDLDRSGLVERTIVDWLRSVLTDYDNQLLRNLTLHLRPALVRIKNGISITNPYCNQVKTYFPVAFDQALALAMTIEKQYHLQLTEDEIAYLALHFESFIERRKVLKPDVELAIVCSTGYGTAELLKQRVMDKLPDVQIVGTLSVNELMTSTVTADIIISTIPLKMSGTRVIQVSPFLNDQELSLLEKLSQDIRQEKYTRNAFVKLLSPNGIITNSKATEKKMAIIQLTDRLEKYGYVDNQMQNSALAREQVASTIIDKFAIPHGDIDHVLQPTIGIMTSKKGIKWDHENVHIVFFVALNRTVETQMDDIYSYFYNLIQDGQRMTALIKAQNAQEIIDTLAQQ